MRAARATSFVLLSLAAACGGSGPPGGPSSPTPPPGSPVSGFVFYDENANGIADPNETMRLPGVTVTIGSASAQTTAGGRVTVSSVLPGAQAATLRPDTLPVYFTGASVPVTVPQPAGTEVAVPATLAIGSRNHPRVYMAFGDSITSGDGSNDGSGYRNYLSANLASYWGSSHAVLNEGVPGTKSNKGESRMTPSLTHDRPAYALILYGTNDWNECRDEVPDVPCYTIDALRSMVHQCRDAGSFPVLGTIPLVNPAYVDRQPTERNDWVKRMNDLVRAMAKEEQVPVADMYDAFMKKADLPSLFYDDLHPNETGYALMAQVWTRALTQPLGASTSRRGLPAFFASPAGF